MEQTAKGLRTVIAPAELLHHWQGHRDLTRRTIVAFPNEAFFTYSIGAMRPFSDMVMEMLGMCAPGLRELTGGPTGELVEHFEHGGSKDVLLEAWDAATAEINELFPLLPEDRFHDRVKLFGKYEGSVWSTIFYFIDNEIHHRAQGYVYLRALGIEPPYFWSRP